MYTRHKQLQLIHHKWPIASCNRCCILRLILFYNSSIHITTPFEIISRIRKPTLSNTTIVWICVWLLILSRRKYWTNVDKTWHRDRFIFWNHIKHIFIQITHDKFLAKGRIHKTKICKNINWYIFVHMSPCPHSTPLCSPILQRCVVLILPPIIHLTDLYTVDRVVINLKFIQWVEVLLFVQGIVGRSLPALPISTGNGIAVSRFEGCR